MTLERCLEVADESLHHAFFGAATGAVLGLIVAAITANTPVALFVLLLTASAAWSVRTISLKTPKVRYDSQGFYRD